MNMMKKICLLVLIMVLGKMSFSQGYPVTQYIGTDSAVVISRGAMQSRLVNYVYTDTTQANTQRIKAYPGAQIVTTNGGTNFILWIRNQTATRWLQIPAGSGVGNIYTVDGTLTGNRTLLGANNSLTFNQISSLLFGADTTTVTNDGVATLNVKGAIGRVLVVDTTAPADERIYELKSSNGEFFISKINDAQTLQDSTFYISSGGNIGINTFSPGARLGVNGNTFVKGQLFAGDTALSTYQVEGILTTPYVLGRKAVDTTLSTQARPTGVQGHVVGRGPIANRLQGGTFYATTDSASTANSTGSLRATTSWTAHNGSGTLANAWGSYNIVSNKTTGTITNAYGSVSGVENRGATSTINKLQGSTTEVWNNYGGTIDTAWGQVISIYNNNASSNIGAVYGLSIGRGLITPTGGTHFWRNAGTIGSSYGIYLDSAIDVGTNRFALYSNSYSDSYLKGNLGLGTTTPGGRLAIVDTGGFALKINYNSASTVADSNAAIYAENNGTSSYVAILNEKTTNNTGGQYPLLVQSSLLSGTAQAGMATGIHFATPDAQGNKKVTQLAFRTTTADSATYTNRAELRLWNNGSLSTPYYLLGNGNMGLGTSTPDSNLTVVNGALFQRGVRMSGLPTGTGTKGLRVDANGTLSVADTLSNGVSGSGTTNYISKFTGSSTIGNSTMQDDGTNVGIGITPSASIFNQLQVQYAVLMGNSSDATANYLGSNFYLGAGAQWKYIASNQASQFAQTSGGFNWNTAPVGTAGNNLTWTTRMQLTNAGLLGVGTSFIDSNLTVGLGTHLKRGVRMSALPTGVGTKALRIDANGTLSVADTLTNGVSGSLVSGYITKATGTNSIDTSQIYQNNGRIGVSTTSPQTRLMVAETASDGALSILGNASNVGTFKFYANNGSTIQSVVNSSSSAMQIGTFVNSEMNLITNSATRVSILNNGNVGIGSGAATDSMLTVENGARFKRGVRMSGLPTGVGTKSLRVDANGTVSVADTLANGISGTGTTNYIPKFTSSSAIGNSVIYESGGSIGIGTTSLDLVGSTTSLTIDQSSGNGQLSLAANGTVRGRIFADNSTSELRIGNPTANPVMFFTNNTERMRLDASGRLLIGTTTSSGAKLDVVSGAGLNTYFNSTGTGIYLQIANNGNNLGYIGDGSILISGGSSTDFVLRSQAALAFSTNGNTERMRLDASGNLGLGTSSPATKLQVIGQSLFTGTNPVLIQRGAGQIGFLLNSPSDNALAFNDWNGTTKMLLDASGNLGLGVSPSAWASGQPAIQIGGTAINNRSSVLSQFSSNQYWNGANHIYITTGTATLYTQNDGAHSWATAVSGTAGNAISFTQAMTLDASGRLGIGTTSPGYRLEVNGDIGFSGGASLKWGGNTYIYGSNNVQLEARVNGNLGWYINSSGNVGIGTTSPTQALQVVGQGLFSGGLRTTGANGYSDTDGTSTIWVSSNWTASTPAIAVTTNHPLMFLTNNSERMRITSGGNVGIGTTSPNSILQIKGAFNIERSNTTDYSIIDNEGNLNIKAATGGGGGSFNTVFFTGGSERMRITSGGELLINTTSDAGDYKLQVSGAVLTLGSNGIYAVARRDNNAYAGGWYSAAGNITLDMPTIGNAVNFDVTTANATFGGSIKTAAPSGGTATTWKLGSKVAATVTLDTANYIEVEVNGVAYKLAIVN